VTSVAFTVLGKPAPAGSKRSFAVRRGGVLTGQTATVDDSKRSRPWKDSVAAAAHQAHGIAELLDGPLELLVDFYVGRPAGHYGTGRNRERLKASAPPWPTVRPDATKLLRAVEDALTGLVWRDDAQVVSQAVRKLYGNPERAEVTVRTLDGRRDSLAAFRRTLEIIANVESGEWGRIAHEALREAA
jgi:Holliday junction resolvase RusA-like endonuclease